MREQNTFDRKASQKEMQKAGFLVPNRKPMSCYRFPYEKVTLYTESRRFESVLKKIRQQILILNISHPDLDANVIAWALYDGAKPETELQMQSGDEDKPPYRSVLAAMRDGWFVIQIPTLPYFVYGQEHQTGHLPYEYVLERRVEVDG